MGFLCPKEVRAASVAWDTYRCSKWCGLEVWVFFGRGEQSGCQEIGATWHSWKAHILESVVFCFFLAGWQQTVVVKTVHFGVKWIRGQCWLGHSYTVWTGRLTSQSSCPSKEATGIPPMGGWWESLGPGPQMATAPSVPQQQQGWLIFSVVLLKVFCWPSRDLWLHFLKQFHAGKAVQTVVPPGGKKNAMETKGKLV